MAQESNLIIEVSTDNATWAPLTTLPANSTSHSHTGLTAGALRYYRLKAVGNGSTTLDSPWVYANATTNAAAVNIAPVANAGADQNLAIGTTTATLNGSATDSDGTIASYAWSVIAGTATITTPNAASTGVTGLAVGVNTFRLTVTDNQGATHFDEVTLTVATEQPTYVFASFTGPAGTPLSEYTPEGGSFYSIYGAPTLDGSGSAMLNSVDYGGVEVQYNGTRDQKVFVRLPSSPPAGIQVGISLRVNAAYSTYLRYQINTNPSNANEASLYVFMVKDGVEIVSRLVQNFLWNGIGNDLVFMAQVSQNQLSGSIGTIGINAETLPDTFPGEFADVYNGGGIGSGAILIDSVEFTEI